jgi:release factor glutamine methyltransferase
MRKGGSADTYESMMSEEEVRRIRTWHEAAYQSDARDRDIVVRYLDREFVIPPQVHSIQEMAEVLGRAVLREVRSRERVLDMGTGSGVNAILAASKSTDVVAVDVSPLAVACAAQNAIRNGVDDRIDVHESDVFQHVSGRFDLIIFDPPFRWFKPRDLRERGTADENYTALRAFFRGVEDRLSADGRVLISFGTSGDLGYLRTLIDTAGLRTEVGAKRDLVKDGQTVTYYTFKLARIH